MRKYFLIVILILVFTTITSCHNNDDLKVGSVISFGNYEWRVLDIYSDSTALIIAENTIMERSFVDNLRNSNHHATWELSDLRTYLNSLFLETFTEDELRRVLPRAIHTPDNEWYRVRGGNDTEDYVFLLSIEEILRYFDGNSQAWSPNPPLQSLRQWLIDDQHNSERVALDEEGSPVSWWLRSPGFDYDFIAIVMEDGSVAIYGTGAEDIRGVRPALILRL